MKRKQDFKVLCRYSEGILLSSPEEWKQRIKEAHFQIKNYLSNKLCWEEYSVQGTER